MPRILYKYLDITGAKCMIGNSNLQFTNATQLNDPFDCHPKLLDYSNVPKFVLRNGTPKEWWEEKENNKALNLRNETWLCSLSRINDSLLMWSHYCWNHSGVCIGLDLDSLLETSPELFGTIYVKPLVFNVRYQDIIKRPDAYYTDEPPWYYQWRTKAKEWEYEQEVRLVMPNPSGMYAAFTPQQAKENKPNKIWDWKEIHQYMPLKGDCFDSIYFGINTDPKDKEKIINHARKHLNPNIKLYQMTVDENAFRLNAEDITNLSCTSNIELKKKT